MSSDSAVAQRPAEGMNAFERYLTLWVALCIVAGIIIGQVFPAPIQAIGALEVARVNLPVGILIWVMIIPMLLRIDFAALGQVKDHARGIGVTLRSTGLVKPFSMALLAWIFIKQLFAPWLPADQLDSYVAGLILLAAAPCTAMVFVWSRLTNGDPYFTLTQVALNDTIMIFAFAPIVALLLGVASITVPWDTLLTSVVLYIVVPVIVAQVVRAAVLLTRRTAGAGPAAASARRRGRSRHCSPRWCCCSRSRAKQILKQPLVIALLAVPILIQVFFNAGVAYLANRALGEKHSVACPSALIGASQLLRAGGCRRDQPVRFQFRRGARNRGRRADRSAGDAFGRAMG